MAPLNGITVNWFIQLMGSISHRLIKFQMSLNGIFCKGNILGYCHHSVNEISYGMAQSDPIKRRPLYLIRYLMINFSRLKENYAKFISFCFQQTQLHRQSRLHKDLRALLFTIHQTSVSQSPVRRPFLVRKNYLFGPREKKHLLQTN